MSHLFICYEAIKTFQEYHGMELVYGFLSNSEKITNYIDEKKFISEINGKNGFITVCLSKSGNNIYVCICKLNSLNSQNTEKLFNITKQKALLVVEYADKTRIQNIITKFPESNYIFAQSFLANPLKHLYSPYQIKKIDFGEISDILKIKKTAISEINYYDPVSAYMLLKKGDVIEIHDLSPVNGINVSFRMVI